MEYGQIKKKMKKGDMTTCGDMMNCYPDVARGRFRRKDPRAIEALSIIIKERERMIKEYQIKHNLI